MKKQYFSNVLNSLFVLFCLAFCTWTSNVNAQTITPPSSLSCNGGFLWENEIDVNTLSGSYGIPDADLRMKDGGATSFLIPGPYPAEFGSAFTLTNIQAVSWDAYQNRSNVSSQPNEQWKMVFKKNGSVVYSSAYTQDLGTGTTSAEWIGSIGSNVSIPNGVDAIYLVHYEDDYLGAGSSSSANSVVPVSVCLDYIPACDNVTNPGEISANQSGCSPYNPTFITSLEAPSGGSGDLEIVWITRQGTSGSWSMIPGESGLTYDPGVITETTQYRRCARRAGCTSFVGESNILTVTISGVCCDNVTNAGQIGVAQSGCLPFDPAMITSLSDPSGGSGALEYVWLKSTNGGSNYTVISGANASTYNPGSITETTWYRRCARRAGCTSYVGESNWVKMTVTGPCCDNVTNAGQIGVAQSGCNPFDPAVITSLSDPSGGSGALEYVWLKSTNGGSNYTVISGANASTYNPGSITETTWYRRCSRRAGCTSYVGESNWVKMTVTGPCCDNVTNAGQIGVAQSGCLPFDPAMITSLSDPSGGSGALEYVWLKSTNGGSNYTVISGANASTYNPGSITETTWYRRCARRAGCTSYVGESNWVMMTVTGPCCDNVTDAGEIGYPQSGCSPFDPAELVSVEDPSGGSGALEFVWLKSTNGGSSYSAISGANGLTYNPGEITQTTWFRRCARRAGCTAYVGESNWVMITVGTSGVNVNVSKTDVTCDGDNSNECEVVHFQNGAHAVWFNELNGGSRQYKFEGGHGTLVENEDGTGHFSGIVYNTSDSDKKWQVDINLTNKKTWAQWSGAGGDWKGNAGTVGNNYQDWSYYSFGAGSRMIGLGDWAGQELAITQNSNAPQYAVQVGIAANDKNGNYGLSAWFDFSGDQSGRGDFNFDIQNCVESGCDGTATASASGGTAPYTYLWDNGMTTSSIDELCAGQYCVSVVDANGCTSDEECVTIGDKPACCNVTDPGEIAGGGSGCAPYNPTEITSVELPSGGSGALEYVWLVSTNGGSNYSVIAGANGPTYNPGEITETTWYRRCARRSGCSSYVGESNWVQVEVTGPCCDNATNGGTIAENQTNCGPFDVAELTNVSAPSGGSGDLEIIWITRTGTSGSWSVIPGSTGLSYNPGVISVTTQYRRCARREGCTSYDAESNIITIAIVPGIQAVCSSENGNCANENVASASVSASGGTAPYTYLWSTGATTASISNLTAGSYSVTVTDVNGCEDNCSVNVTNTECCNVTDPGEIAANGSGCAPFDPPMITSVEAPSGGLGALEIVWITRTGTSGSWSTIAGATGLTYDPGVITQTTQYRRCARRAGCTSFVGESNIITMTVTGPCCDNVTNGGIIAENQENCGPFDPAMLTSVSLPSGGSGALEYVWLISTNGGSNYSVITGANGPTYDPGSVSVTTWFRRCARRAGCVPYVGESNWVQVTVHPNDVVADCNSENGTCNNNNEGSASVSASGGTAPYSYAWSNGATTSSIDGLVAGTYSVTVTDANGCSDECSVTVSVTPCCNVTNPGAIAASQENCGGFDPERFTSVSLPSGGLGNLEYVWLERTIGGSWSTISGANGSEYDAPYTDVSKQYRRCARRSGCTTYIGESNILTITVNPGPTATCSKVDGTCANDNEGSASVSMTNGTSPYTYAWSNGATTATISSLAAGTYSVTVTDANGCTDDCSVTVSVTPCCNVTDGGEIAAAQENCGPFDPAAFTSVVDPTGGLGTLEYVWLWNANNVPMNNGNNGWVEIPNSNSATYDPGYLTESRCFIRCARRSGCTTYVGESNVICVTINPEPVATCSSVDGDCNNNNEASASVSASGGTAPYTYAWSNGATTSSIDGLSAGTYSVTVTDANGCTDDCSVTVSVTPCCNVTNPGAIAASQESCGGFDPERFTSVSLPSGGLGDLEYVWLERTIGGSWSTISGANGPTYDAPYTNVSLQYRRCARRAGCNSYIGESNILTITVNPGPTATCSKVDGTCNSDNEGSASVSMTNGTAPYTYAWSNGATTASISGLDAGTYSVTVTDANGCSDDCSVTVSVTPCCNVTNPGEIAASQENCGGFDPVAFTSVSLPSGGLGDLEYVWLVREIGGSWSTVAGANGPTYDAPYTDISLQYRRCARRAGCTSYIGESNILTITVNPGPTATCTPTNGTCANNNEGSASVSASGGTTPYTYEWNTGATTSSISSLAAGTYSVTVTDANGCTDDCSVTVTVTPCCNVTSPGEIAADQENCGGFDPEAFTSVSLPSGGLGDLEYVWLVREIGGSWSTVAGANGPTYDAPYTDISLQYRRCARRAGCTSYIGESNILTITVNPGPTATCSKVDGTCANDNEGSASVSMTNGTAPYTYAWSNGATTSSISGLAAGTYSVTVTDANGCSDDCSVTITTTPCCNVTNGGEIAASQENCGPFDPVAFTSVVDATGGLGDLEYVWLSNDENVPMNNGNNGWVEIPNSNSATYDPGMVSETTCYIRCARRSGCTTYVGESNVICVTINPGPTATCSKVDGDCNNNNEASASVSASGGTAPYSYAWSNGATTQSIDGLSAGTYSVTVTDANGCSDDCSVTVSVTPCCNVTDPGEIAANQENCGPFDPVAFTSVSLPSGGLGDLEYVWLVREIGGSWSTVAGANGPTYDAPHTDISLQYRRCARRAGCTTYIGESNILTITVNPDNVVADCSSTPVDCNGASTGSVSVAPSGGTAPYTVLWSTGATTMTVSNLTAGSYSVTVTDANGCSETCTAEVEEPTALTADCSSQNGTCSNNNEASASVSAAGGTAPYSYAWSNGATTSSVDGLAAGTYSVTVTDANGCTDDCSVTVTVTPCCNVTDPGAIAANQENCGGFDPERFTSVSLPSGGLGDLEYVWLERTIGGSWSTIPGANDPEYDAPYTDVSKQYRRCARRSGCTSYVGESNILTITVNPIPVATCTSVNGDCNNNNVASASVSAAGGTEPYTYAWSNGETTSSISGLADGTYSVTVTDANGCSDDCSVTVATTPCCDVTDPGTIAADQEGCGPFDPVAFTSIEPASGGLGGIVYQWYQKETETSWWPIPGATNETYDAGMISIDTKFKRCARREGCPEFTFCSNVVEIDIKAIPNANCSSVSGNCNNGNGASATVSAQGGTPQYTYLWSNGATTSTIDDLADGTYSVTVTDENGCVDDCSVTVTTNECCNVTNPGEIAASQENCGAFDPVAFTSVAPASGGIGPVEYVWLSGACGTPVNTWTEIANSNSETIDVGLVTETTCFIRCARNSGCSPWVGESNIITITVNDEPVATCSSVNGDCINNNEASASVTATGGSGVYSYAWSNGATTASISGLEAGTYSVTVTDMNGCSDECSVTVTTTPCCNVTDGGAIAGVQENCGPFDPAAFTSVVDATGGLGDLEYVWLSNDENVPMNNGQNGWVEIPNSNSATYDAGMVSETTCYIRCARRSGCTTYVGESNVICVTVNEAPVATCTPVNGDCNNNNEASASVSVDGGTAPYTYEWSNGATTASIENLDAGTYSVTVTDANGCTSDCSVTVSVTPCCNVTDGGDINNAQENCGPFDPDAITSIAPATGGLGDLEYIWLMNDENVPMNNGQNGWVEIPGSNGATYDPGMITETTCYIRCARRSGCTTYVGESNVVCMTVNESPVATCSSTDSGCNGTGTGTATVSATGGEAPYTYAWSNGGTTATITGLMAGSYSVTVTDANGCTDDCIATVGEPSGLTADCSSTDASCNGVADGTAGVNATGGSAPYTYAWSTSTGSAQANGATTASLTGVAAGTYSVTVTDANGCTATCSATVSEPTALTADCSSVDGTCNNNNEASASVSVSGGDEPYSYAWSNGATTSSIDGLAAGTYSVTVTDANGCTADCSVTVSVTPCCNVTDGGEIAASQENCGPFDPAAITSVVDATGGLGDLEYIWLMNDENVPINNGQNGWVEIPNSNSATYDPGMLTETTCFIRCARREGCTVYVGESNVVCMTVNEAPVATCTPVNGDCNNGNVASASVSVTGGTEPYSVLWSTGATTMTINNLEAGSYNVTVTDVNGCEATCTAVVEITPCCNVTDGGEIAASQENCGPFDPAEITSVVDATGGLGDLEYVWLQNDENVPMNNGQNGWVEIPNSNSATYDSGMITETTCFIRCARREGCATYVGESNVVCMTVNEAPVATCTPVNGDCNNGNLASVSVSVSGGTEPYAYEWSTSTGSAQANGATTASIGNLTSGTYSVTVADANGCTSTCDVTVEVEGCCNVTDGGEIAGAQENCGPFDPAAFTSVVEATGGLGDLEYIWLMNDENVPLNNGNNGWVEIPGSNSETFDPGMVTETTCFIRCARREGCTTYVGESNVICVTVYPEVEVACNPTHGDCSNNGVGAVSTSITGGTAPFTYAWSTGATTADISGLGAGTYDVTVTDANGCVANCSVTIVSEPCCNVTDGGAIAGVQENCGPFDPATLTSVAPAMGGIGPVEYIWLWNANNVPMNNGQNGWVEIPGSNSETYDPGMLTESRCFIRCARNVGCTTYIGESNVICITVNDAPVVTCTPVNGDCNNGNVASASVSIDGGVEPYTVFWSTGAATTSISNLTAGSYSVTVTDANGCEATCSVDVETTPCCNVADAGEIAADQSDCGPFDPEAFTSVSLPSGGLGDLEYVWLVREIGGSWSTVAGANGPTYDAPFTNVSLQYRRCARRAGCTTYVGESNILTITVGPGCCDNVTDGGEIASSQENCGPFDPAAFTSVVDPTGGSGDLEYVWLMNDENVPMNNGNNGWVEIPNSNSATYDAGMVTETTCFIRCARRSGCVPYVGESNVICVTVNPADLTATCTPVNGDCNNGNLGSASVTASLGEAPYTYEWSNGATTSSIDGLAAGTYTVTVTDANGCSATCDAVVEVEGCCNVVDPGKIATEQENCGPFDVDELTDFITPTGGVGNLEIVWITREGTTGPWQMIAGAGGLTYDPGVVSVTTQFRRCVRREGCTSFEESNIITITIYPAVEVECMSISGDCGNGNMGSASVEVLNGTAPYTYAWSNGETTAEITGLESGTYTVVVTDANGCTATCTEEVIVTPCCNVTDPGAIAADQTNCIAFDPEPFTSVAPATGGIGPVEYVWLSGACGTPVNTWNELPNSNSETYDAGMITETTCFIRCARNSGCEPWVGESNIITITIYNNLSIECTSVSGDCGNGNTASASVDVLNGTAPFTYEWSNGATTASIEDIEAGTYTVIVTDANGCTAECTEEVIVTPCCNVTEPGEIAASQTNCGAFDPAPFTSLAPASGGIGPVEYLWLRGECGTPVGQWTAIANSNSETLDVDSVFETTCFIRCARNSSCQPWAGESNIITITVYPAIEMSCNGVNGDCSNDNEASANAHIAGGTEPYSILWSNGDTTASISGLDAGTYTVLVSDANGCEAECSVTVEVTPCCNVTDGGEIAGEQENCGSFDPEAFTSIAPATGGIGPVEYAWYSGPCPIGNPNTIVQAIPDGFSLIVGADGETYDAGMLEETTCFIRVARNNGCEEWLGESNIITITVNPAPVLDCVGTDGDCENGNVASASVSVNGASSPFTYFWSNGEETASIDSLDAGSYTVIVTDANGCEATCDTEVDITPCCNVTDGGEIADSQENCGPFDPEAIVSVTSATGGIGPVEYAWYSGPCPIGNPNTIMSAIPDGFSLIVGATGESYDPGMTEETTCYMRVARNNGCEEWLGESNIITITINNGPALACSSVDGDCENENVGSASVTVSGAPSPFSYAWSNGATTASIENLEAGTYSVVVTDANGCVDSCSVDVEVVPCCNVTDGGEIAEEQENCGPFDPAPIVSVADATGGIGPVEYAWYCGPCPIGNPNTLIPEDFVLIAGANGASYDPEYSTETKCYIRVARNEGCTEWIGESNIITITVNDVPTVEVSVSGGVNPTCDGEVIELTADAPNAIDFAWSSGETTASIAVTESGMYVVTITDENGCTAMDSIEVEFFELPEVEIEVDGGNPFCDGDSIMLTANCATATGFVWSTGETGTSIWVTEAGTYSVDVVDANECTASTSTEVEVYELPEVEISIDGNNPLCSGDSALLTAVSQGAISYAWSNGSTDSAIWVYEAGVYSVTITDEVGCENTTDYQIIEGLEPTIEIVGNNEACSGESIVLTAEYAGGEAVLWSTGQTTQEITVTESGEYCVMTASIDGCQAEACVTITINPRPEVEVEITSGSNPFCVGDSIELTAVSQTATAYAWSNGSTNASIWVTEGATYTVEVTDENGCASSAEMAVGTVESPEITIEGNLMFCAGDSTRLSAIAGKTVDYLWSTGATTEVIWVTEPGEYCVTGTSNYGCETEVCVTVTEFPAPDVYAGEDVNICVGDDVMLTATGGNENTVYTWYLDGELVSVSQSITVSPGVGITEYSVVAINEFCSINSTDHVKVSVYEHPLAGFERDPAGDVPFGSDVNFTDTTMGQVTDWHWDFGDGMTSMLQHPTHNYTSPGSYWVELVAANHGCTDTARAGLEVKVIIDIPNVFTPNNDGVNDMIWLEGTDLELIKMTIFNRWGHSVYASEGRQFGWSGKNSGGEDAEPGTYYYVIEMNYKDGNVSEQTGFFTLIR